MLKNLIIASLLLCNTLGATYVYEGNQNLFDLTNESGTTNLNAGDDQLSVNFDLDFTFTFYGEDFTAARMATNGCLHFGLGSGNVNYNNYCGDYTPDPLPHTTYTLYPFYTDLIRDSGSKMLGKNFTDKSVFGWYNLREYNRANTDNSFEVILWKSNDSFEFRYGGLNIQNHDVLIGEQGSATQTYTYLYYDECSTGTTNISGTCTSTNWNNSSSNTLLENGGSLYGVGSGNALDCSNPLNNEACSGYAAAYLAQQCGLDSLYSESCPSYWDAYDDLQCTLDPQYSPSCAGYSFEESYAYYYEEEQFDYGYEEDYNNSYGITDDYYLEDTYGYTEDYFYEDPIVFQEEFYWDETEYWIEEELYWEDPFIEHVETLEYIDFSYEEEYVFFEEQYEPVEYLEVFDVENLTELYEFETIIREEIAYEEEDNYLVFENFEELEEWFEEEMEESQETTEEQLVEAEEEIFEEEAVEEIYEELEEEWIAETDEEITTPLEELDEIEISGSSVDREQRSSISMETALNVVANTVQAAATSISGTTAGTSIHATGNTASSGGTSTNTGVAGAVASSSSGGGFSTSSSPSMSDQFTSASVQTNTVLSMSIDTGAVSNVTTISTPMPTTEVSVEVAVVETQVQDMQGQIDTAMSEVSTPSEADQVADQIVAQNLKSQQEEIQTTQENTGEYADQSVFVAYLGYNAGFTDYYDRSIPSKEDWYEPRDIYADAYLGDNTRAFYQLAGDSLNTLQQMRDLQPTL